MNIAYLTYGIEVPRHVTDETDKSGGAARLKSRRASVAVARL